MIWGSPWLSCFFLALFLGSVSEGATAGLQIKVNGTLSIGSSLVLGCYSDISTQPYWTKQGDSQRLTTKGEQDDVTETIFSNLEFEEISLKDFGIYSCIADGVQENFELAFPIEHYISISTSDEQQVGSTVIFNCSVTGYPLNDKVIWSHEGFEIMNSSRVSIKALIDFTTVISTLTLEDVTQDQNGSYSCGYGNLQSMVELRVLSSPVVTFGLIKAIGVSRIFVNWTALDGNTPITELGLIYYDGESRQNSIPILPTNRTHCVLEGLQTTTQYFKFSMIARNKIGIGNTTSDIILTTLRKDPSFIPIIAFRSNTYNSVTVVWTEESTEFFHHYNVLVTGSEGVVFAYEFREDIPQHMIKNLNPGTTYVIKIRACSDFTSECDSYSNEVNVTTLDGFSSAPLNLTVQCIFNQTLQQSVIKAFWNQPLQPRGQILEYLVLLFGNVTYRGSNGMSTVEVVGPVERAVRNTQIEYREQPPNTNYYLSICAKTRTRVCGEIAVGTCYMPPSIPSRDELSKVNWKTVARKNQFYFMVTMPYISPRNGTFCCFRIVVVRLIEVESFEKLGLPGQLKLTSYDQVHNSSLGGAYVAELLDPNGQSKRIVMIGDGDPGKDSAKLSCDSCYHYVNKDAGQLATNGIYRRTQTFHRNSLPSTKSHRKRHASSANNYLVYDGPLHPESTYTAYLDALVITDGNEQIVAHSHYFSPLKPTRMKAIDWSLDGTSLGSFVIGSLLVALIVVVLAIMCVMRWRRKEPGDEEYGLTHSLRQLCRRLRGQQWVPSENTIEIPPIPRDQIIPSYLERHKEGDYGFQQEFENLPDRFCDRSCHESDKRDNIGKNRYPDIKAYDQTRVRLFISDTSHTSDYINANYVVGYKERKKFICAQGPMESTVVDWWRMIWEQRVTLILMLTNTEEYNKTKCAKYWPSEGTSVYGDISVTHNSEKEFSDYLVRNLQLKRSRPSEQGDEEREVLQYHYLVWKDFMAPEYPYGIIRFIKRFNDVYSPEKGPILVHCSAGVGRTGTLVALDSLLEQLAEENTVSIFNTICDLRHQRNFLVQSLKQYIFIYRALMEAAQFGDTEIKLSEFKSALERLKGCEEGRISSKMEDEFEKLSLVIEDRKAFSIGTSDENRHRNRHDNVIPYDRCRVILSPMPSSSNEICTYINASFIEGYDNTEQFVMTQDPLENTIGDFWRMIVEQNIRMIVMFSEVGEENCPRYWPEKDQETAYDYIRVKYMQSQSFPFYYKREFTLTNSKSEDSFLVTQFQYNGWPVGSGEVPESTRGLVELVDTTLKHQESMKVNVGPTVVHCSDGAQRSCIFVALAILVKQMMTESRVDIFSIVRKLRSQRQNLFQNIAQYDLVYRGLLTYSELHIANGVDIGKQ